MTTIIPSRKAHQRLPSDDDLQQRDNPGGSSTELLAPARWKGKGKATEQDLDGEQSSDIGEHPDSSEQDAESGSELTTYPPTNDDEAESKRIEDNLRRWEEDERQKRRAQRESKALSLPQRTSVVEGGWAALWSRTGTKRDSTYNPHRPLRRDTGEEHAADGYAMHRADSPATPVPHTPGLSPATQLPASDAAPPATVSPFADVAEAATGPLMEPSSLPPTPGVSASAQPAAAAPARPVLQAAQSTQLQIPSTSRTTEPPGKIIPPRIVIPGEESEASSSRSQLEPASPQEPPTRWWTEWLCGCREEKTEQQGGATNPFE